MTRKHATQTAWLLAHLRTRKHITPISALTQGGIMRLAARINDLRNEGHESRTKMLRRNGKRFASYHLHLAEKDPI